MPSMMSHPHEKNARKRPVADSAGVKLSEAPRPSSMGSPSRLCPVATLWTKTSRHSPVTLTRMDTRLLASDLNATTRPFPEIVGSPLSLLAPMPDGRWLTRCVRPVEIV